MDLFFWVIELWFNAKVKRLTHYTQLLLATGRLAPRMRTQRVCSRFHPGVPRRDSGSKLFVNFSWVASCMPGPTTYPRLCNNFVTRRRQVESCHLRKLKIYKNFPRLISSQVIPTWENGWLAGWCSLTRVDNCIILMRLLHDLYLPAAPLLFFITSLRLYSCIGCKKSFK